MTVTPGTTEARKGLGADLEIEGKTYRVEITRQDSGGFIFSVTTPDTVTFAMTSSAFEELRTDVQALLSQVPA